MLKLLRPAVKPYLRLLFEEFDYSQQHCRQSQQRLLGKLVGNLAATEYGQSLNINAADGYDEFRTRLPIVTYDDISEWVERQKQFERNALVSERVLFYEKTSGSSAAAKFIPYTRSLKDSFNRMFLVWLYDLLASAPTLSSGKAFISVSPAFRQPDTTGLGVTVGLEDDSEYLSRWAQVLLKPFFVLPPEVKRIQDPENFKRVMAALLFAEHRLEVISVWNPSFLEIILNYINANRKSLIADLEYGRVRCEGLEFAFKKPTQERLALFEEDTIDWQRVWRDLKIISCWASAHAASAADRLRSRFPDVFIQGKGLLATEAPMTLPLAAARGFVPLPAEVFYEFLDDAGNLSLLHELDAGREYEIIISQQGGLCRYRIGDRVRVTHFYGAAPCLEFVGRSDAVCDLVGEKLSERFAQSCLARLSHQSDFQTLVPVMDDKPYYLLVVDGLTTNASQIAMELEPLLCEAYHYRNARLLSQLGPVRALVAPDARNVYYDYFVGKGVKLGDIKHQAIITNAADAKNFISRVEIAAVKS